MQKYVYLKHDFSVDRKDPEFKDVPPDQELTLNWLRGAIVAGYPNMKSDQRRMYSTIVEKIKKARADKSDWLPLNQFEILFIKTAFDVGITKADDAPWITIAENALLNAKDSMEAPTPSVSSAGQVTQAPQKA